MHVIAATALPLDDDDVDAKCRHTGNGIVLTKDERVRLWRGHGRHDWQWVYDRQIQEWFSFRRCLTEAIRRDGFNLKFAVLVGPDHSKRGAILPWNAWDCEEIITSDIGSAADFSIGNNLLQLRDCEPWEYAAWSDEALAHYAVTAAAFMVDGLSLLAPRVLKKETEKS